MGNLTAQDVINKGLFMIGIFLLASVARGEWLMFIVYLWKDKFRQLVDVSRLSEALASDDFLQALGLQHLPFFLVMAVTVSFTMFWGIGFYFDRHFYKNLRHKPEEWKCQPDRWLTKENERHEFILGSSNMFVGSLISGVISCYIINGGENSLYVNVDGVYDWLYLLCSVPALYMYNEVVSYYPHRFFHNPWLYRNFHKIHHGYGSPTLYSTTAMHPAEFLMYEFFLAIPAFIVPLHVGVYLTVLLYGYYYGMMDHSGINMDAIWPWQPSSMFHDDHHRHFHCNFGFNTVFFDKFHKTLRQKDREYGEAVFGGRGKPIENYSY